jgi:hypothetical protein
MPPKKKVSKSSYPVVLPSVQPQRIVIIWSGTSHDAFT